MQLDIEIALIKASRDIFNYLKFHLPAEYYVEDHSDRGWGIVIRKTGELSNELSETINCFLLPLSSLKELISNYGGILRIGVFYSTVNCTMRLSSFEQLSLFGIPVELSIYSSSD